jgi:hypothetical protein
MDIQAGKMVFFETWFLTAALGREMIERFRKCCNAEAGTA